MTVACRNCNAELRHTFVDLGPSPLANSYVEPDRALEAEPFYSLHAYVCDQCFLVQLPAVRSSVAIGGVTLATMVGMRHSGLPPVVGLAVGGLAAVSVGLLAAWVAPTFALGHDGVYARNMLLGMLPALRKRFAPGRAS